MPRMILSIGFLLLAGVSRATDNTNDESPINFKDEEQAIDERGKLRTGSFQIHQQTFYALKDRGLRQDRVLRCDIDRARIRWEVKSGDQRWVSCVGCSNGGEHLAYFSSAMLGGKQPLIVLDSPDTISRTMQLPHPRLWGMMPLPFEVVGRKGIDEYLTRPDRTAFETAEEVLDGNRCQRLSFRVVTAGNLSTEVQIWICPAKGNSVLRMDQSYQIGTDRKSVDSIVNSVQLHTKSGLWFPVGIRFTKHVEHLEVVNEKLDIRILAMNEPIDGSVFSMASLPDLVAGTKVQLKTRGSEPELRLWDGTNLTSVPATTLHSPQNTAALRRLRVSVGAIMFLIAAALFYRGTKRS